MVDGIFYSTATPANTLDITLFCTVICVAREIETTAETDSGRKVVCHL